MVRTLTAKGPGSIPGWGAKILQTARCGGKKRLSKQWNIIDPKKEGNSDTTTRVNLEDIMLSGTIMLSHKRLSTV